LAAHCPFWPLFLLPAWSGHRAATLGLINDGFSSSIPWRLLFYCAIQTCPPENEHKLALGSGFGSVTWTCKNKGPGRMYVNLIVRMTNGQLAGKETETLW